MTKEELEKEAYLFAKNSKDVQNFECGFDIAFKSYLASAEPREKRIAELQHKIDILQGFLDRDVEYQELQKENAELKEKLNRYKHICPNCSAFGKHCPHRVNGDPYTYDCYLTVADLEKENAELKEKLEGAERARDYWKDSSFDWRHKCTSRKSFKVAVKAQEQLTKAKEIIKRFSEFVNNGIEYSPEHPQEHTYLWNKLCEEAEQFLQETVI